MKIFLFLNIKGGPGKTTTSFNFAVNLTGRGYKVVVIDTDTHSNLSNWWNNRENPEPGMLLIKPRDLESRLADIEAAGYDFVIIDTPGNFPKEDAAPLARVADLIVVPSKSSPLDLWATAHTINFLNELGLPMVFIVNEVKNGSKLVVDAMQTLSQHGKVGPVVEDRQDFVLSPLSGEGVEEFAPGSAACKEADKVALYLLAQIGLHEPSPLPRYALEAEKRAKMKKKSTSSAKR